MALNLVTGYKGQDHVTAEQWADFNRGIFGDSAVLPVGNQMAVEILRKIDLSNFSGINKTVDIPSLESQENNFLNDKELSNSIMDTECKTDSKDVPMLTEEQKDESI